MSDPYPEETTMPTTNQSRKAAVNSDYAPLYAVAGLADIALETVKITITSRLADARARQVRLAERAEATRSQVRGNAEGAVKVAGDLPAQLKTLPEQLRQLPDMARAQLAQAQKQAEVAYADFAGRGKVAVDGAVLNARKLQAQAAARAARAGDGVAGTAADLTEAAERIADDAKTATGSARRTTARKAGGTASAAQRAAATKKPSTRKASARKDPARKTAAE